MSLYFKTGLEKRTWLSIGWWNMMPAGDSDHMSEKGQARAWEKEQHILAAAAWAMMHLRSSHCSLRVLAFDLFIACIWDEPRDTCMEYLKN